MQEIIKISSDEAMPEWYRHYANNLLAVLNGERDAALADDDAMHYSDAAELVLLMERLEQSE